MSKIELPATPEVLNEFLLDPAAVLPQDTRFYVGQRGDFAKDAELAILLDSLTGQPYPLGPQPPSASMDLHHGIHPHDHEVVVKTLGGRAMRCSQLQVANKDQHNEGPDRYHALEIGPLIHREVGHQFGMCLMAVTGAQHRMGIHTEDKKMWLEPLNSWQTAYLRIGPQVVEPTQEEAVEYQTSKHPELSVEEAEEKLHARRVRQSLMDYQNIRYGFKEISIFFRDCVLRQDLGNINAAEKRMFVDGRNEYQMLTNVVKELVNTLVTYNGDTVATLYDRLWGAGRLNPLQPADVGEVVLFKLGSDKSKRELINDLQARVALVLEQAA